MTTPSPFPFVHILRISSRASLTEYALEQGQIRTTALTSPSMTPPLTASLTAWNTATDKATALAQQERVLTEQLHALRQSRILAAAQAGVAEVAFVGMAGAVAQNDPQVVRSFGLAIQQKATTTVTPPEPPATVTVKPGTDPGGLHASWTRAPKARSYQVQVSPEPVTATSWTSLPAQTKRSVKIGDLSPNQPYQVRVATVTAAGQSAYGTAARGMAR